VEASGHFDHARHFGHLELGAKGALDSASHGPTARHTRHDGWRKLLAAGRRNGACPSKRLRSPAGSSLPALGAYVGIWMGRLASSRSEGIATHDHRLLSSGFDRRKPWGLRGNAGRLFIVLTTVPDIVMTTTSRVAELV
jgi:hypothetical protein